MKSSPQTGIKKRFVAAAMAVIAPAVVFLTGCTGSKNIAGPMGPPSADKPQISSQDLDGVPPDAPTAGSFGTIYKSKVPEPESDNNRYVSSYENDKGLSSDATSVFVGIKGDAGVTIASTGSLTHLKKTSPHGEIEFITKEVNGTSFAAVQIIEGGVKKTYVVRNYTDPRNSEAMYRENNSLTAQNISETILELQKTGNFLVNHAKEHRMGEGSVHFEPTQGKFSQQDMKAIKKSIELYMAEDKYAIGLSPSISERIFALTVKDSEVLPPSRELSGLLNKFTLTPK